MKYDFETYLLGRLEHIKDTLTGFEDVQIFISEEQNFAKMDELTPDSIYIVIKYLSSSIEYYAETMPIQILVLSEQNSMEKAQMLMSKFTETYNWNVIEPEDDNIYIKQQYNSPVVLNNYVEVGYGYRSVLYVTGTLFIMENLVDVKDVYIDGYGPYKPLSFNISYSMSTNTQQLPNKYLATSVKTVSTFSIAMAIPMVHLDEDREYIDLVDRVLSILNDTHDGNESFIITFTLGVSFSKTMRLISAQIMTAPNQIPSLQLGFME